jgi:hypothetical protein
MSSKKKSAQSTRTEASVNSSDDGEHGEHGEETSRNTTNDPNDPNDETNLDMDNILLNLKIIGSIREKDRLSKDENDVLEIENNDTLQGVRRWWLGRSRRETLNAIRKVIQGSFRITDSTLEQEQSRRKTVPTFYRNKKGSQYFHEDNSNLLQRFLIEMTNSLRGLDNLKQTYSDDVAIHSEINILKEQLELRIKKINSILKIDIDMCKSNQ